MFHGMCCKSQSKKSHRFLIIRHQHVAGRCSGYGCRNVRKGSCIDIKRRAKRDGGLSFWVATWGPFVSLPFWIFNFLLKLLCFTFCISCYSFLEKTNKTGVLDTSDVPAGAHHSHYDIILLWRRSGRRHKLKSDIFGFNLSFSSRTSRSSTKPNECGNKKCE